MLGSCRFCQDRVQWWCRWHWQWARQSLPSRGTCPPPTEDSNLVPYTSESVRRGFRVILGAYAPGSRRIPAVEPLVARQVLILGVRWPVSLFGVCECGYWGISVYRDQIDIDIREYEGKEVYQVHIACFERTRPSNVATQPLDRQLSQLGHGVIVEV